MAEYKDIHGTTIRNSAGNLAGAKKGELFYDSTNRDFKYQFPNVTTAGAFRTGGNLNSSRSESGAAGASNTAGLAFGGYSGTATLAINESYNGSSWTEVGDLNTTRFAHTGAGIQTSAITFGGYDGSNYTDNTETWNGSSWTELADLASAKSNNSGSGSAFAGLSIGGPPSLTTTDEWTSLTQNQTITIGQNGIFKKNFRIKYTSIR